MSTPKGPLDGIRIIDMSVMISGPLSGMLLADQGADVIKVESPGIGDMMRYLGTSKNGTTGIFVLNNRGKRSLVVDLKKPEGIEIMHKLIATADVLIQNFRPGALDRLGLGYDDLSAINKNLIYVSISGFGPDGPNSGLRVYDNVIQSASGLISIQTDPRTGEPSALRTLICDKVTALTASQAITAALFARERGAAGQHITLAMLDAAIAFIWPDGAMNDAILDDDAMRTPTIASNYGINKLQDGYCTMSVVTDAEFRSLCSVLGVPEIADDERFSTAVARGQNAGAFVELIGGRLGKLTCAEFVERARKFDLPGSVVISLEELPDTPQVKHNEVFVEREHPTAGRIREVRSAPRFSKTPAVVSSFAPAYGQHSDDIVTELGLDASALRAAGVIL